MTSIPCSHPDHYGLDSFGLLTPKHYKLSLSLYRPSGFKRREQTSEQEMALQLFGEMAQT